MTKEEKRTLFNQLLEARPHGEGPAKLAKWLGGSPSAVYRWQAPGGPWPTDEEKEARIWAFFGYELDEYRNPVLKKAGVQSSQLVEGDDDDISAGELTQVIADVITKSQVVTDAITQYLTRRKEAKKAQGSHFHATTTTDTSKSRRPRSPAGERHRPDRQPHGIAPDRGESTESE